MVRHLSIDIETFSSIDLKKVGLYRYVQSPDFQILLFAYSFNCEPVQIIDLAQGDPFPAQIAAALQDPSIIKHAYNATFECYSLNKFYHSPISQWNCTMLHGLYCGYPSGLAATAVALGLPEDKRKLGTGMALIRTFCVPKKAPKNQQQGPTLFPVSSGPNRVMPHHEPEKWNLFKKYCIQDVVTEMEVEKRLSAFPVPEQEQRLWELDQYINAYGVAVDQVLIHGALQCSEIITSELMTEAIKLSGLDNPKSVQQLSKWLEEETGEEITDLQKSTVKGLIKTIDNDIAVRMLEIRQELSKTSVKKYTAMDVAVCGDGRVRGLLQFYGANRTGRWCLTGDHEVLTPSGWKRLDEWEGGEIACWSPQTECISFQNANRVSFDYSGEMYHLSTQRCEQISTPDHKMPFLQKDGAWGFETVEILARHRFTVPFTGRRLIGQSFEPDKLRVLIMTQADGHYTHEGDVRYHFKKKRKIERCKHLLRRCQIPFIIAERPNGTVCITIKNRCTPIWLRLFQNKTFGYWMLDESADVIFDELPLWDGYACGPNSIQYSTTNRQNAEVIQAAAVLSGRSATLITKTHSNENWQNAYIINIWNNPGHGTSIRIEQVNKQEYTGKVYCAETKTGYFLVRRNGKVWITGNSGRLVQVQNLPRNYLKTLSHARDCVKSKKVDALKLIYGNIPDTLSQLIRTAFIPSPENVFLVADFSAIEARVIAWLAGEQWRLEVFATHGKIYEASASQMFGVPIEKITKGNPEYELRQKGKVAELALGYQGGSGALISMGALNMGLAEEELPEIVRRWRSANKRIVDLWYSLENATLEVMRTGQPVGIKGLILAREGDYQNQQDFLTITLPSQRKLFYPRPFLSQNAFGKEAVHYYGTDQHTKKWGAISTYGGKLVENCLSADTLVLTKHKWKKIIDVHLNDLLWDGVEWVRHKGLKYSGKQQTINLDGVRVTPEHGILTTKGWLNASSCEGYYRDEIKLPDRYFIRRIRWEKVIMDFSMRLWKRASNACCRILKSSSEIMRLPKDKSNCGCKNHTWDVKTPCLSGMAFDEGPMYFTNTSGLGELRWAWNSGLSTMVRQFRSLLGRHGADLREWAVNRSERSEWELLPRELSLGIKQNSRKKQAEQYAYRYALGADDGSRSLRKIGDRQHYAFIQIRAQLPRKPFVCGPGRYEPVYDLINAGQRHRFTVMGKDGPFIVHNCVQAIARDCLAESLVRVQAAGYQTVMHVHDEVVLDLPSDKADLDKVCELMGQPMPWAPGLQLKADGFVTDYYMKD